MKLFFPIKSNFYRELHEAGHSDEELMEQLRGDIEDQVSEYPLPQLVAQMLSFKGKRDIPILVVQRQQEFACA